MAMRVHVGVPERAFVKDLLESLVGMMVERGIRLEEAVNEFEKKFIKRVLEQLNGNQSRAALALGIHRNTLSRKVDEYKLDHSKRR
jgi:DNA-binding protein Fis